LGVLHTNCGVSCHNSTPDRKANLTNQNLRLDVAQLDGRAPDESWAIYATAVGKLTEGAQLGGSFTRIAPGDPARSHVLTLMKNRTPGRFSSNAQMPPIATRLVDDQGLAILTKWISRLPGGPADGGMDAALPDAGATDAGVDAGPGNDAGMDAGAGNDAASDAGGDAGLADAAQPHGDSGDPDAAAPDAEAAVPLL
jgi:hypothetical protein